MLRQKCALGNSQKLKEGKQEKQNCTKRRN